jgi:hypothetical protein
MGEPKDTLIPKLITLMAALAELDGKRAEVVSEINDLLGGKPGIGIRLRAFMALFIRLHATRYPGWYVFAMAKDAPQIKRLLKMLTEEDLERRVATFIRNDDPFFVRTRHTFAIFASTINQHAGAPLEAEGFDLDATPVGCHHQPACSDDAQHTARKNREMRA